MKIIIPAALVAAVLVAAPASAAPAAAQTSQPNLQQAYPSESYTQYYRSGRGHYRGGARYARPYYGRSYGRGYYGRRDSGAAAAAGVIGLATGAIIGGAIANQQAQAQAPNPDWIAYCSQKYRSFDPASGTFLGYDGQRHVCQ
jgi:hypothetical protein